jgi:hypothetical protein
MLGSPFFQVQEHRVGRKAILAGPCVGNGTVQSRFAPPAYRVSLRPLSVCAGSGFLC